MAGDSTPDYKEVEEEKQEDIITFVENKMQKYK